MKSLLVVPLLWACACGSSQAPSGDLGSVPDLSTADLMPQSPLGTDCSPAILLENYTCLSGANDYHPRDNMSMNDIWPACISDDNTFHLLGASAPPSAARVAAFESVGPSLWAKATLPETTAFVAAATAFGATDGLAAQLVGLQDPHYPQLQNADTCAANASSYPDRCAGATKLLPVFTDAMQAGKNGSGTHVAASRLEAVLLWSFYLSAMSDSATCSLTSSVDCDSQWSDVTGGKGRDQVTGLSGYVSKLGLESKDRIVDGTLAVRCWRDFTSAGNPRDDMFNFARQQLDRALLHGLALVARQRFSQLGCATGQFQEGHFQFVKILVGLLDRASRTGDPSRAAKADVLKTQINAATAAAVDVAAAVAALDALYPACP